MRHYALLFCSLSQCLLQCAISYSVSLHKNIAYFLTSTQSRSVKLCHLTFSSLLIGLTSHFLRPRSFTILFRPSPVPLPLEHDGASPPDDAADELRRSVAAMESHDYIMKIVPTVYEHISGNRVVSYQYTYAYKVSLGSGTCAYQYTYAYKVRPGSAALTAATRTDVCPVYV